MDEEINLGSSIGLLPEGQVHLVECWREEKPGRNGVSVLLWALILLGTLG